LHWKILPPFQGLEILWTVDPGQRSQTRFALGYHLPGFQPFGAALPPSLLLLPQSDFGWTIRFGVADRARAAHG